jgi:hypothetical protein
MKRGQSEPVARLIRIAIFGKQTSPRGGFQALEGLARDSNMHDMDQQFRDRPVIDMTPEGEFRDPAPRRAGPLDKFLMRIGGVAALVAVIASGVVIAGLAIAFFAIALPIAAVAGLIAFGSMWWRIRRAGQAGRPFASVMRR